MTQKEALTKLQPEHAAIVKEMIVQEVSNKVEKAIDDKFHDTKIKLEAIDSKLDLNGETVEKIYKVLAGDEFSGALGIIKEHQEMYTWFRQMKWVVSILGVTSMTSLVSLALALNSIFHWF